MEQDFKYSIQITEKLKELVEKNQDIPDDLVEESTNYSAYIENQFHWQSRDHYLYLFEQYQNNEIDSSTFYDQFFETYTNIVTVIDVAIENRIVLSIHLQAENFGLLIDNFYQMLTSWDIEQGLEYLDTETFKRKSAENEKNLNDYTTTSILEILNYLINK